LLETKLTAFDAMLDAGRATRQETHKENVTA
jgi:hypothetical protein